MQKTFLIATAFVASVSAGAAFANPHVDRIIQTLRGEGYTSFEMERTWLGRIRIEAEKGNIEREIVINRTTGEVLRDYIVEEADLFFGGDDPVSEEEDEGDSEADDGSDDPDEEDESGDEEDSEEEDSEEDDSEEEDDESDDD
jgi:hypothetical protein